jgi:hypothetical protein
VQGAALVPAAFFVELVRAAAEQSLDEELSALEAIEFKKGLFVPEEGTRRVQLVLRPAMPGTISFELFGPEESGAAATLHVTGRVVVSGSEVGAVDSIPLREIRDSCSEELSGEQHYERALAWGLEYGPSFQTVRQVSRRDGEALARLVLPPALASEAESHGLHPALLDGCLQALAAALSSTGETGGGEDAYLPVAVGRFRLLQRPEAETEVWAHARLCRGASAAAGSIEGDVVLRDASGSPIALAEAVRVERVRDEMAVDGPGDLSSWLYQVEWEQKPLPTMSGEVTTEESSGTPRWVVFADREGIGEELASSLRRRGDACAIVFPGSVFRQGGEDEWEIDPASPERYQRLLDSIAPGEEPLGLVHAWSLEPEGEMVTLEGLESAHWLGWQSVLHLLQALQRGNRAGSARLWLVTAGVQPIGRGASISIAQAPLWGLGRTIALDRGSRSRRSRCAKRNAMSPG